MATEEEIREVERDEGIRYVATLYEPRRRWHGFMRSTFEIERWRSPTYLPGLDDGDKDVTRFGAAMVETVLRTTGPPSPTGFSRWAL